jgi:hypothetical protein
MTTTVKKGTGRAAAEARRAKAAQVDAKPTARRIQREASKASGNTETKPESHPERREDSGPAKVARLIEALRPAGWKVTSKTTGNRIEATAKRKTETLVMAFVNGGYDYGTSSYSDGDKTRKIRNVSEAIRLFGEAKG